MKIWLLFFAFFLYGCDRSNSPFPNAHLPIEGPQPEEVLPSQPPVLPPQQELTINSLDIDKQKWSIGDVLNIVVDCDNCDINKLVYRWEIDGRVVSDSVSYQLLEEDLNKEIEVYVEGYRESETHTGSSFSESVTKAKRTFKNIRIVSVSDNSNYFILAQDNENKVYVYTRYIPREDDVKFQELNDIVINLADNYLSQDRLVNIVMNTNGSLALNESGEIFIWLSSASSKDVVDETTIVIPDSVKSYLKNKKVKQVYANFASFAVLTEDNEFIPWGALVSGGLSTEQSAYIVNDVHRVYAAAYTYFLFNEAGSLIGMLGEGADIESSPPEEFDIVYQYSLYDEDATLVFRPSPFGTKFVKDIQCTLHACAVVTTENEFISWGDTASGGSGAIPSKTTGVKKIIAGSHSLSKDVTLQSSNIIQLHYPNSIFTILYEDGTVDYLGDYSPYMFSNGDDIKNLKNIVDISGFGHCQYAIDANGNYYFGGAEPECVPDESIINKIEQNGIKSDLSAFHIRGYYHNDRARWNLIALLLNDGSYVHWGELSSEAYFSVMFPFDKKFKTITSSYTSMNKLGITEQGDFICIGYSGCIPLNFELKGTRTIESYIRKSELILE